MATSKSEIREWFQEGVAQGAKYMIVVCDTWDWEDYPSYANTVEQARLKAKRPGEMQKTMEVYDLEQDAEAQLSQHRCWNLPPEV